MDVHHSLGSDVLGYVAVALPTESVQCADVPSCSKISTSYAEAGQGNGDPYNITDGDFVVGNFTEFSKYLGVWNDISGRL